MVHQYKLNGCNIVIDTCSGSIHSVDDVAYDIISMYETSTPDEIVRTMLSRYGDREDVTEEDAQILVDSLTDKFPDCEIQLSRGGQPVYYYILSVE